MNDQSKEGCCTQPWTCGYAQGRCLLREEWQEAQNRGEAPDYARRYERDIAARKENNNRAAARAALISGAGCDEEAAIATRVAEIRAARAAARANSNDLDPGRTMSR